MRLVVWAQIFILTFSLLVAPSASQAQSSVSTTTSLRRNIATVIFCGLGGAVLGISTLSFYGDPGNHIGNITTGLALGMIGGATYVATQSYDQNQNQTVGLDPVRELIQKNRNPKSTLAWAWNF